MQQVTAESGLVRLKSIEGLTLVPLAAVVEYSVGATTITSGHDKRRKLVEPVNLKWLLKRAFSVY